jgi:hypothetical protein
MQYKVVINNNSAIQQGGIAFMQSIGQFKLLVIVKSSRLSFVIEQVESADSGFLLLCEPSHKPFWSCYIVVILFYPAVSTACVHSCSHFETRYIPDY